MVGIAASCAAGATRAEEVACRQGVSRETTERLFALLNHPPAEADCKFEGVRTDRATLEALWSHGGVALPAVRVVPRECATGPAAEAGAFAVAVPPEIEQSCPSVLPLIGAFLKQVSEEAPAGRHGSAGDPLYRGARALFLAIFAVVLVLFVRGAARLRSIDAGWAALGLAGFAAALALRSALPFSLGNWYSEVMPASGPPPWMRFGPGFFAFQSLLRDAGTWSAHALVVSQLLLGSAAVALLVGVLRELNVGLVAAAATTFLFILAPFHALLSATPSEHVLASTACVALLLCWLRAVRTGDVLWFVAAALLLVAVCSTRVDMTIQALAVLPWPLMADRTERERGGSRASRPWMIATMTAGALSTTLGAYFLIAIPSQHPMPDWQWHVVALRQFLPQFWFLATGDPPWMSLSSVVLAPAGALAMVVRRPLLLVRVAGTLLIAFVGSGRTLLHDELLAARYFLFAIPLFLILSGHGLEALVAIVPRRARAVATVLALGALAVWTGLAARSAYSARYAFQDEYSFARAALAALPAGCSVYQVQIRADVLPHDVDCCLDLPRSPLVLDYPALRFLDLPDDGASLSAGSRCVAYYEGVACAITPGPSDRMGHDFARQASDYFQARCAQARRLGSLELVAETTTSPRTTEGFFGATRPPARLYRSAR